MTDKETERVNLFQQHSRYFQRSRIALAMFCVMAGGLHAVDASANVRSVRALMDTPLGHFIYTTLNGEESLAMAVRAMEARVPRLATMNTSVPLGSSDAVLNRFKTVLSDLNAQEIRQIEKLPELQAIERNFHRVYGDLRSSRLIRGNSDKLSEAAALRARVKVREWLDPQPLEFVGGARSGVLAPRSYSQRVRDFLRGATQSELEAIERRRSELARLAHTQAEVDDAVNIIMRKLDISSPAEVYERLAANRLTLQDVLYRVEYGLPIPQDAGRLERFYHKLVWGWKDRKLANPDYLKTSVTTVIAEAVITMIAEPLAFRAQGKSIEDNLDILVTDLLTFTLAEIVLVWKTAGRMSVAALAGRRGGRGVNFRRAAKYSMFAREFASNIPTLGATGIATGMLSNGTVQLWRSLREEGDSANPMTPKERLENALWNGVLAGVYMSTSSNFRYMVLQKNLFPWMKSRGLVSKPGGLDVEALKQVYPWYGRLLVHLRSWAKHQGTWFGVNLANSGMLGAYPFDYYRNGMTAISQWMAKAISNDTGIEIPIDPEDEIDAASEFPGMLPEYTVPIPLRPDYLDYP